MSYTDYARWHPHLHALVAVGLFLESGYLFVMPKKHLWALDPLNKSCAVNKYLEEWLGKDRFPGVDD